MHAAGSSTPPQPTPDGNASRGLDGWGTVIGTGLGILFGGNLGLAILGGAIGTMADPKSAAQMKAIASHAMPEVQKAFQTLSNLFGNSRAEADGDNITESSESSASGRTRVPWGWMLGVGAGALVLSNLGSFAAVPFAGPYAYGGYM